MIQPIKFHLLQKLSNKQLFRYQGVVYTMITEWLDPDDTVFVHEVGMRMPVPVDRWLVSHMQRINTDKDRIAIIVQRRPKQQALFANPIVDVKERDLVGIYVSRKKGGHKMSIKSKDN